MNSLQGRKKKEGSQSQSMRDSHKKSILNILDNKMNTGIVNLKEHSLAYDIENRKK